MNDTMNEITAFSPFGGRLVLEEVKGAQERANVPENSIETKAGDDRSMYVYVPASGCPDAKQTVSYTHLDVYKRPILRCGRLCRVMQWGEQLLTLSTCDNQRDCLLYTSRCV